MEILPADIKRSPEVGKGRSDKVDVSEQLSKPLTLVVESQLYAAGALVSFYAYTIGKLPNHKGR